MGSLDSERKRGNGLSLVFSPLYTNPSAQAVESSSGFPSGSAAACTEGALHIFVDNSKILKRLELRGLLLFCASFILSNRAGTKGCDRL